MADISLNERQLCDFELIANGAFAPLNGFMGREDYESVLKFFRLKDGTVWSIPICLDISAKEANHIRIGQSVELRDPEGFLLGRMHVSDLWQPDLKEEALTVYQTHIRMSFQNT